MRSYTGWQTWELEQRRDAVMSLLDTYLLDMSARGKSAFRRYALEYDNITAEIERRQRTCQMSLFDVY